MSWINADHREYDFVIADVFSASPFAGNQLAVIPNAAGLSDEAMQHIAAEFNFPETTFVLPADDPAHARRVRIFTPRAELDFAGHPTVGTACALRCGGHVADDTFVLEERVGPIHVSVSIDHDNGNVVGEFRTTVALDTSPPSPIEAVCAAIGLPPAQARRTFNAGLGVNFCFVELESNHAVDAAELNSNAWTTFAATAWAPQIYLYSVNDRHAASIYARMFAPALGVAEDPATGSAAAALAAILALDEQQDSSIVIDQGVKAGRPSRITASGTLINGHLDHVTVSGSTTLIASGTIRVPTHYVDSSSS
jgi:trans-2,3-dihydro-3-hydroxyanthranilate isomerase